VSVGNDNLRYNKRSHQFLPCSHEIVDSIDLNYQAFEATPITASWTIIQVMDNFLQLSPTTSYWLIRLLPLSTVSLYAHAAFCPLSRWPCTIEKKIDERKRKTWTCYQKQNKRRENSRADMIIHLRRVRFFFQFFLIANNPRRVAFWYGFFSATVKWNISNQNVSACLKFRCLLKIFIRNY